MRLLSLQLFMYQNESFTPSPYTYLASIYDFQKFRFVPQKLSDNN